MSAERIEAVIAEALALRNLSFTREARLIADLGMDSYDVVSLIIEIEAVLDTEFDEDTQVFFIEGSLGEISDRLAQ